MTRFTTCRNITIHLGEDIGLALLSLSETEARDPRAQALIIIRDELARRGLIKQPTITDYVDNVDDTSKR